MAVFSTNQVRQLYVAKIASEAPKLKDPGHFEIGHADNGKTIYFKSTNALGEISRSDLIKLENILDVSVVSPKSDRTPKKSVVVTLNSEVNGGRPIVGEDYILNIHFRQYVGMSDTDIYIKQGFVRAYSGMTNLEFYSQLACSLFRNFMREPYPLLDFYLGDKKIVAVKNNNTGKPVPYTEDEETGELTPITATTAGVTIVEAEQEWRLGVKSQVPVYFDVYSANVEYDAEEVLWATVTDTTPVKSQENASAPVTFTPALDVNNSYGNGRKVADLEYFCHGERGDMYRGIAWPHNLETKYLVDPTQNYYIVNIHYAYIGANESVQKSEKDITIVTTSGTVANNIITATGFDVAMPASEDEPTVMNLLYEDEPLSAGNGTPIEVVGEDTPEETTENDIVEPAVSDETEENVENILD